MSNFISSVDLSRLSKNILKQLNLKNEKELKLSLIKEVIAKSLGFNNLHDFKIAKEKIDNYKEKERIIYALRDHVLNKIVDYQVNMINLKKEDKNKLFYSKNKNIKKLINFKMPDLNKCTFKDVVEMFFSNDLRSKTTLKPVNISARINITENEMSEMCDVCHLTGEVRKKIMYDYYTNYDLFFSTVVVLEALLEKNKS